MYSFQLLSCNYLGCVFDVEPIEEQQKNEDRGGNIIAYKAQGRRGREGREFLLLLMHQGKRAEHDHDRETRPIRNNGDPTAGGTRASTS